MTFRGWRRAGCSAAWMLIAGLLAGAASSTLFVAAAQAELRAPASTTIALTSADTHEAGAANARQLLSHLRQRDDESDGLSRRLVALPDCDGAIVEAVVLSGLRLSQNRAAKLAWVQDIVRIREQTVAVVAINSRGIRSEQARLGLPGSIEIVGTPQGERGPISRNTGPFTSVCERAILNYDASGAEAPAWSPPVHPTLCPCRFICPTPSFQARLPIWMV